MLAAWTPGVPELLLIGAVILLLFGAKKVPEMARALGKSQKEFKKGMAEGHAEADEDDEASGAAKPAAAEEKKD